MNNLPKSRQSNIVIQELEKELLIYDLKINKAYCLNQTAQLVFELCNGHRTVSEISRLLTQKLKNKVDNEFVWLAINDLQKIELMESSESISNPLTTRTRREVIKKIGLASMIALPVISSIVAPHAAMALSVVNQPFLSSCSSPSNCAAGLSCGDCFQGTCPPGGDNRCCVSAGGGRGPGGFLGCYTQSFCSSQTGGCCSGQINYSPSNCFFGQSDHGDCSCV